jgi:hypothetical protein
MSVEELLSPSRQNKLLQFNQVCYIIYEIGFGITYACSF